MSRTGNPGSAVLAGLAAAAALVLLGAGILIAGLVTYPTCFDDYYCDPATGWRAAVSAAAFTWVGPVVALGGPVVALLIAAMVAIKRRVDRNADVGAGPGRLNASSDRGS